MTLRELIEGQRFEFEDQNTHIFLKNAAATTSAAGIFVYLGRGENTCPLLLSEVTGVRFTATSKTYDRYVLPI